MASTTKTSPSPHHRSPLFTPIEEGNEDEEFSQARSSFRETTPSSDNYKHHQTPLHNSEKNKSISSRKKQENGDSTGVSCNKCRPSNKDKISVQKLHLMASPNAMLKSIVASLAPKKSPKSTDSGGSSVSREEHWKIAVSELSNKLIQTTRKRDEAVLEASKLKYSMGELEKKLNKLEIYCHNLKSGLEVCSTVGGTNSQKSSQTPPHQHQKQQQHHLSPSRVNYHFVKVGDQEKVIEHFLISVSEARSSIQILARALVQQLRQMGVGKVYDRITSLLQPYDIKISFARNNPRGLVLYLEALLNRAFFEDFESVGYLKGATTMILNPIDRCEANFAMFSRLQGLTWEAVLNKGTKHFSEDFSKFCDRKMSEIVAMLGWDRAWSEQLLQAFFRASKSLWFVHLMANSVHPALPIFRVGTGSGFDAIYMEDTGMGGDKVRKLVPAMVRIMVNPGFYVYNNVVKCKVLCRYYSNPTGGVNDFNDKV